MKILFFFNLSILESKDSCEEEKSIEVTTRKATTTKRLAIKTGTIKTTTTKKPDDDFYFENYVEDESKIATITTTKSSAPTTNGAITSRGLYSTKNFEKQKFMLLFLVISITPKQFESE